MDLTKFDVILGANSESFAADLKKALRLKDGETLEIMTPQFTRTDGRKITYAPRTEREYDALKLMDPQNLKDIGCQMWDKTGGQIHWLYPYEWYPFIPNGYVVTDIMGGTEPFVKGKTDDDIRFGALSFGFIQTAH